MLPIRPNEREAIRLQEPEEIRDLTKKALHARLENEYYLPEQSARGVNRAYLVGIFTGQFYRVLLLDWKRFDAELTPA